MAEVWIPSRMQTLTDGRQQVQIQGATMRQIINNLEKDYPGMKDLLLDEDGENIMPGVAVVIDGETGVIVDEDPAALAAVWRRLLDNGEERRRLGEAARRRAETVFAGECAAERLEQLYAAALTGP